MLGTGEFVLVDGLFRYVSSASGNQEEPKTHLHKRKVAVSGGSTPEPVIVASARRYLCRGNGAGDAPSVLALAGFCFAGLVSFGAVKFPSMASTLF